MVRKYQRQRIAKTKTILAHLNQAGLVAFDQITRAMVKGYKVSDKPSLSLIVQSVLINAAKNMTSDQLKQLKEEIRRHGCKPRGADLKQIAEALAQAKAAAPPTTA